MRSHSCYSLLSNLRPGQGDQGRGRESLGELKRCPQTPRLETRPRGAEQLLCLSGEPGGPLPVSLSPQGRGD